MTRSITNVFALGLAFLAAAPAWAGGYTERVSVSSGGQQANGDSGNLPAAISPDGRFVTFFSTANNLVEGDTNSAFDAFLRDRRRGQTERVSLSSTGKEGNKDSYPGSVSADGRFVAFGSDADNLADGDTNGVMDIFVRDRRNGTTERVSLNSADEEANGASFYITTISANGRFVLFHSEATNLVAGDNNHVSDLFVRDRLIGKTGRVSIRSDGQEANGEASPEASMSADGRFVAFSSFATNLVSAADNDVSDIFVHDRRTDRTTLVSKGVGGRPPVGFGSIQPAISADGRYATFGSDAGNLDSSLRPGVFLRDLWTGKLTRISVNPAGDAAAGIQFGITSISPDGGYVAFYSDSPELVPEDTTTTADLFLRDWRAGKTELISKSLSGSSGDQTSYDTAVSAYGRFVAFDSAATNLVAGDSNGTFDVFVRTLRGR